MIFVEHISRHDTAVPITDPQHDVVSEEGVAWRLVRDSVQEHTTVSSRLRRRATASRHSMLRKGRPAQRRRARDGRRCQLHSSG
jgi:hypothetical protein